VGEGMKTALVTGAARGLGLELVRQYAADGWRVLACHRTAPAGAVVAAMPGDVVALQMDVTDHRQVDEVARRLAGETIDLLINNAGLIGRRGFGAGAGAEHAFGLSDYDIWDRIFHTNVMGPMKVSEAFVGHVAASGNGKIVMLTSVLGSMALNESGGLYAYRASKAALNAITRSMAIDLAPRGIVVAGLHPGWVRTEMGGSGADIDAETSVAGMRRVISGLTLEHAGRLLAFDGNSLPF